MIDRQALKSEATRNMSGKKPNVFLVAAIYVVTISILAALMYTLSGYDRFFSYIEQIFPVNPYPTYGEVEAAIPSITTIAGLLIIAILISRTIIDAGYMGYCLKLARNEETDIKTIFDGFSLFLKILRLKILQYAIIFLWSCFFVIPGIIAYYRYRQALYILLDNTDKRPLDCLRESKQLMSGRKAELFFLDMSFIGWRILGVLIHIFASVPLLSLWLAPYTGVTYSGFYNRLVPRSSPAPELS